MIDSKLTRLAVLAALSALAGCADPPAAPAAIKIGPAVEAQLARADAVDGAEDHVVSRCSGCGLAMPGDAGHALQAGDYTMHFCSDRCRHDFAAKGDEAILALEIPEADPAEPTQ